MATHGTTERRIASAVLGAIAVMLVAVACSTTEGVPVTIESGTAAASNDGGTSDNARRFEPVDAKPGDATSTPTPRPAPPTPDAPAPAFTPSEPPSAPLPASTPTAPDLPPIPAPPFVDTTNDCPGVVFTTPALFVWGLAADASGLEVFAEPRSTSEVVDRFGASALAQGMTAGCRLGDDGTPWYEFISHDGRLGYADSRYLVQAVPVCLRGPAMATRPAPVALLPSEASFSGKVAGHAAATGGERVPFIPNSDIGMTDTWWLVPSDSVDFDGAHECDPWTTGAGSPPAGAHGPVPPEDLILGGDCATGPTVGAGLGPVLLVDLDRRDPIDAFMPSNVQRVGGDVLTTWSVRIGTSAGIDDAACGWLHTTDITSGTERGNGVSAQHEWFCIDGTPVQLVQRRTHRLGDRVTEVNTSAFAVSSLPSRIALETVSVQPDLELATTCTIVEAPSDP